MNYYISEHLRKNNFKKVFQTQIYLKFQPLNGIRTLYLENDKYKNPDIKDFYIYAHEKSIIVIMTVDSNDKVCNFDCIYVSSMELKDYGIYNEKFYRNDNLCEYNDSVHEYTSEMIKIDNIIWIIDYALKNSIKNKIIFYSYKILHIYEEIYVPATQKEINNEINELKKQNEKNPKSHFLYNVDNTINRYKQLKNTSLLIERYKQLPVWVQEMLIIRTD